MKVRDWLYARFSPFSVDWFSTLKRREAENDRPKQASYPFSFKEALYVELPSPHEPHKDTWSASIKVDYDVARNPLRIATWKLVAKYLRSRNIRVTRAFVGRSRKGFHLRLWVEPYIGGSTYKGCYTVLRIQEMLQDDPVRQSFNRGRVARKRPGWNVLFTHKFHNCELTSCEKFDPVLTLKASKIFMVES